MNTKWWKLRLTLSATIGLLIIVALTPYAIAQQFPLSSEISLGPNPVGFESVELYDYSRVFRDKYDYDGNPRAGETARPMQICIWYPADDSPDARAMVYGEYAFPAPADGSFYPFVSALQNREIGFLAALFGPQRILVQETMNLPVVAMKEVPHAEGSFPLIIYHPDANRPLAENAAMCEALASHGYIVAASHSFGITDIRVGMNSADLETLIRDREFIFAYMRDYPGVDISRVGLIGNGFGGLSALLMQMRNTDIQAVAVLDGIYNYGSGVRLAVNFPSYGASTMDVPLLQMYRSDHDSLDLGIFDSLVYSDRRGFGFANRGALDFTDYATAAAFLADTTGEMLKPVSEFYGTLCRGVKDFFDRYLKDKELSATMFADFSADKFPQLGEVTFVSIEGQTPPPTEAQFIEMIQDDKIERAAEIYEAFKKSRPGYVFFQEATLNAAGYQLLQANRLDEARMIFKINTEAYPNSANVWDSYADACIANGDNETAITCYQKVLEVLPVDSALAPQMRETLLNNANQGLEQLQK